MTLSWLRGRSLARAGLGLGLLVGGGGHVAEVWAQSCRAPSLLTDGASNVANEQRLCTGPWVYSAWQGYPCDPAAGPQCQGGATYQVEPVPNTCRNKAFGGETFRQDPYYTTISGKEWAQYGCWPGYGCGWDGDTDFNQQYRQCADFQWDMEQQKLQWYRDNFQDPSRPVTTQLSETPTVYSAWVQTGNYQERTFTFNCTLTFNNVVSQWKQKADASLCGVTNTVNPRHPLLLPTLRYSRPLLTLGSLKQEDAAAEIRDASLIDSGSPRCTTRDEMPDTTAAQAQAKYTALQQELATGVSAAVAGGYEDDTFRHLIIGAMKRLYELRGDLLTPAQRQEVEGYYRTRPEYEKNAVRVDPTINFWWYLNRPDPKVRPDYFSVRWTGRLTPQFSETYTFRTESDDGIRVWVGGSLVLDTAAAGITFQTLSGPSGPRTVLVHSGQKALVAGQTYDIKVELEDWHSQAGAMLWWESPSLPREFIPSTRVTTSAGEPGFLGEYFDNYGFTSGVVCGNRWTPPRLSAACTGDASVQAILPGLDLDLSLCQRMSLPHTSAALAATKRTTCENLAMGIGTLFDVCGEQQATAYELEYNTMMLGLDQKALAAALAATPTLSAATYNALQAQQQSWHDKVSQYIYHGAQPGVRFTNSYQQAVNALSAAPHAASSLAQ
ncbi:hypothetical protein JGU66_04725 [Myxococcaceae bacterium JPH2]|nr:hypothetical protein [Myxococcaceae bacterium JPH2]